MRCSFYFLEITTKDTEHIQQIHIDWPLLVYLKKKENSLKGWKASKNKLKDANFNFPMTNVKILRIFHKHGQEV